MTFERVSLVEYTCQMWSLYLLRFKSYAKVKVFCHRVTDRTKTRCTQIPSRGIKFSEVSTRSNLNEKNFAICAPWPWQYNPGSRKWHTLGPRTTNIWSIILNQTCQWRVMALAHIFATCALWPWPWRYDIESRSWHKLVMNNGCVKDHSNPHTSKKL